MRRSRHRVRVVRVPRRHRKKEAQDFLLMSFATVATLYTLFSLFAYALVHPQMTQTEVLLSFWDALTWNW